MTQLKRAAFALLWSLLGNLLFVSGFKYSSTFRNGAQIDAIPRSSLPSRTDHFPRSSALQAVTIDLPPINHDKDKIITSNPSSRQQQVNTIAQASLFVSSINLLKNCVGAGVFSINSRVNAITTNPQQYPAVIAVVFLMATWAIHNFYILGETCRITKSKTFGEAWSKAVSSSTQWIVQFVVTVSPMISCLANIIVLTDVLKLILRVIGFPIELYNNRVAVIGLLCSVILYPICTVKDLSGLKSVSVIGLLGQAIATLSLGVRWLDKSYQYGGKFYSTANFGPIAKSFLANDGKFTASSTLNAVAGGGNSIEISKWFVLASLLSYCFVTHYNAPRYYTELKDKEKNPNRFLIMASISYFAAASVYLLTVGLANKLFTPFSIQSFALNSFSPNDPLAVFAFSAFGTSVLASFPLIFFTMRNWFISQAEKYNLKVLNSIPMMTSALLAFIGGIGIFCTDIGKVGALAGAIFGSSMMFIFPSIMYINVLYKQSKGVVFTSSSEADETPATSETTITKLPLFKLLLNYFLLAGGIGVGTMGTINSIKSLFG